MVGDWIDRTYDLAKRVDQSFNDDLAKDPMGEAYACTDPNCPLHPRPWPFEWYSWDDLTDTRSRHTYATSAFTLPYVHHGGECADPSATSWPERQCP